MVETGSDAGFTLIELLVVLTIMALLLAATPALLSAARPGLNALLVTRKLADDLRATRALAVRENRTTAFTLDATHDVPASVPITLTRSTDNKTIAEIDFFADGSATGGLVLVGPPAHRHRILVHWLTGRVAIDE